MVGGFHNAFGIAVFWRDVEAIWGEHATVLDWLLCVPWGACTEAHKALCQLHVQPAASVQILAAAARQLRCPSDTSPTAEVKRLELCQTLRLWCHRVSKSHLGSICLEMSWTTWFRVCLDSCLETRLG